MNRVLREKLDAVRSQLQSSLSQTTIEKSELKSALDAAEEKLRQLSGLEQQLGSIITDAAAAGADVQPFTDVLQAAALGSKGRVAQVLRTFSLYHRDIFRALWSATCSVYAHAYCWQILLALLLTQ